MFKEVKKVVVIDPICENMDEEIIDKVDFIGRFVEDIDISCEIGDVDLVPAPDLCNSLGEPYRSFVSYGF